VLSRVSFFLTIAIIATIAALIAAGWALRERRYCRKLQAEHQRLVTLAEANESRMAELQTKLRNLNSQIDKLYQLAGIDADSATTMTGKKEHRDAKP
jgi:TolA-binding protein